MNTIFIGIVSGCSGWQGPLLVNLEWVAGSQWTCQGVEALDRVTINSFGYFNIEWVAGSKETGQGLSGWQRQLLVNL